MSTSKIIIFSTRFLEFQKLYEQALTDRYQIALFPRVSSPPPPVLLVCLGRFYFQSTSSSEKDLFANGSVFHPLPSLFPNWLSLSIYEIIVFLKGVLFLDLFNLHFSFNSHVQYMLSVVQKKALIYNLFSLSISFFLDFNFHQFVTFVNLRFVQIAK